MPDILRNWKTTAIGVVILFLGVGFLMKLVTFEQFIGIGLPLAGAGHLLSADAPKR